MRNSNWKGHGTGGLEENSLKRLDPADEKMIMTAWVKRCITWEVEGIRQRGRPKKTWWDCAVPKGCAVQE